MLIFGLDMVLNLSLLKKYRLVFSRYVTMFFSALHTGTKMCIEEKAPPAGTIHSTTRLPHNFQSDLIFTTLRMGISKLHMLLAYEQPNWKFLLFR